MTKEQLKSMLEHLALKNQMELGRIRRADVTIHEDGLRIIADFHLIDKPTKKTASVDPDLEVRDDA